MGCFESMKKAFRNNDGGGVALHVFWTQQKFLKVVFYNSIGVVRIRFQTEPLYYYSLKYINGIWNFFLLLQSHHISCCDCGWINSKREFILQYPAYAINH
jgi:hypothetical protein